jgi:16S rRNA (uracil1498-N3)-methyltransferase
MPVFFIAAPQIDNRTLTITGPLLDHLRKSLRVTVGEEVWVADERRHRYLLRITSITPRELIGHIADETQGPTRSHPRVVLGQAVLKGDRMDWVIQKATELGVSAIAPLISQRVIARPRAERVRAQVDRWQRIALEAAQQSECWDVPIIEPPVELASWLSSTTSAHKLILSERSEGASLMMITIPTDPDSDVVLAVGPEGGWSESDHEMAHASRWTPVTLGSRILRAETAAIVAVTLLQNRLGELG